MSLELEKSTTMIIQTLNSDQPPVDGSFTKDTPNKKNTGFFKNKIMQASTINEKTFVTGLNTLARNRHDDNAKMAEIQTYYGKINDVLQVLDQKVGNLLKQHENDFLFAYKDQMYNVQKELKTLKKKIDEETLKRRSDERMNILEEERDWFRAEAIRLDKICKEQQKMVNEFKFKIKIMNEDRAYYEDYILETKKENKALKEELAQTDGFRSPKADSEAKKFIDTSKPLAPSLLKEKRVWSAKETYKSMSNRIGKIVNPNANTNDYGTTHNDLQENGLMIPDFDLHTSQAFNLNSTEATKQINNPEIEKYLETIKELKNELEKEKKLVRQLKSQKANIIIHRTELEQILIDCINEIKKDICKRRSMLSLKELYKVPTLPDEVNFSKFSLTDKKRVIEYFLSNEYVLEELYNMVFGQIRQSTLGAQHFNNNPSINGDLKSQNLHKSPTRVMTSDTKLKYSFNYGFEGINPKLTKKELMTSTSSFNNKSKGLLDQIRKLH